MGAGESSEGMRREYESAKSCFSQEEREKIGCCFRMICANSQVQSELSHDVISFNFLDFERFTQPIFSKSMQTEIFTEMAAASCRTEKRKGKENTVSDAGFTITLSHLLKGSLSEKCEIFKKFCVGGAPFVSHDQLIKFLEELINTYVIVESDTTEFSTWSFNITRRSEADLAEHLISDLSAPDNRGYESFCLEKWLGRSSLVLSMMDAIFQTAFHFKLIDEELQLKSFYTPTIPFCIKTDWRSFKTILNIPSLLLLNHNIPADYRRQWRLLFGSETHGESFSTLCNHIIDQGPCIIVIRDKGGAIFGGFASKGFEMGHKFIGDERCFLFITYPKMNIFSATGYNSNYCYLNLHQETMPNGLGFGGLLEMDDTSRVNCFGLWLDREYGQGESLKQCSTFNSTQLSTTEKFQVDVLEVWGVGPRQGIVKERRTSLLDMDPEVKAMLSMIGKGLQSEGLRESDKTADTPEEHKLM